MFSSTLPRSLLLLVLTACLYSACSTSRSVKKAQSGQIQYDIHLDLNDSAQEMAETFGKKATVWFNKNYLRLRKESNTPSEEFYITDLQDRIEKAYIQFKDKKYAVISDPRMLPGTGPIQYSEEKKTIAGFECRKATAPMGSGEMVVYYSTDFPIHYCPYLDLAGFALEYTLVMPFGRVTYKATEVTLGKTPDALINPPDGFETLTYAAFQESMKQNAGHATTSGREKVYSFQKDKLDGMAVNLADLRGEVVVLNFWFTECPPCKAEIPQLNRLVAAHAGQDVHFFAITFDAAEKVRSFLEQHPFDFQIIPNARDIIRDFEIIAYPTTIVLDKSGKIANEIMGGSANLELEIAQFIKEAQEK